MLYSYLVTFEEQIVPDNNVLKESEQLHSMADIM